MISVSKMMVLIIAFVFCSQAANADVLSIYHIDVDQGDATLFISPSGKSLLVDSGKNGHGARIKKVMDKAGIARVDYFVCTHYHEDHYGGIDDLVLESNNVPILPLSLMWAKA